MTDHIDEVRISDFVHFLRWVSGKIADHSLTWWEAEQVGNIRLTNEEWFEWFESPAVKAVIRGSARRLPTKRNW